jgi:hypothetical protein
MDVRLVSHFSGRTLDCGECAEMIVTVVRQSVIVRYSRLVYSTPNIFKDEKM